MSNDNPLLAETGLPRFSAIRAEHVVPAIDAILTDYRTAIDALTADDAGRDFERVMLVQERLEQRLAHAWAPVSHLHAVADTPALREAYMAAQEKITDFSSALGQNRALYAAVKAVSDQAGDDLPPAYRAALDHALRDFRLSGVALEDPARSRFRAIANELSRLSTDFANAVLDATDVWQHHVTD
ncbi:MAG TPA: oligopeptidase A, partial [Rhodanobacteraceae bacterium]|nr:oligopeptidase A [Rhodanobacteraceae bacterium]